MRHNRIDSESEKKQNIGGSDRKTEKEKMSENCVKWRYWCWSEREKERKTETKEGGAWSTQSLHSAGWVISAVASCTDVVIWNETLHSSDRPAERETERGRIINMMHQVLPEKEVSPLASASRISLLETGTEQNCTQHWLTDWLAEWVDCVGVWR